MFFIFAAHQVNHNAHAPYVWIVGSLGITLTLIVLSIVVYISLRSSNCCSKGSSHSKDSDDKSSHKFHILRNPSFCCASARYVAGKSGDRNQTNGESSSNQIKVPKGCDTNTISNDFIFSSWKSNVSQVLFFLFCFCFRPIYCSSWDWCTWYGEACGFYIWRNFCLNWWVFRFQSSGAWNIWFCVLCPSSWPGQWLFTLMCCMQW